MGSRTIIAVKSIMKSSVVLLGTVFLCLDICIVSGVSECEGGGWLFRNRCYWVIDEPIMPWADANLYCSKVGTDLQLAIIPDMETNNFLSEKLHSKPRTNDFWIGLHALTDGEWRWIDGSPLNYTNWMDDTDSFDCGILHTYVDTGTNRSWAGKWTQALACGNALPFICSETYKTPICPNGGTFFRDRCYWLGGKGTLPMQEADKSCQEEFGENARLPVIRDAEMNSFLSKIMLQRATIWIGLTDTETEGQWKWVDGSPTTYTAWGHNRPDNHDTENCAELTWTNPSWDDIACHLERRYICGVPPCYDDGTANSTCSTTSCSSCIKDSVCFHTGECKCHHEFEGMTCDKANFSMSVHGPETVTVGDNITLSCHTNLPKSDIEDVEWLKIDYDGNEITMQGSMKSIGTYNMEIANVSSADEGAYLCIVTYSVGDIGQVEMRGHKLQTTEPASEKKSSRSTKGLTVVVSILTIACVALLIGLVVVIVMIRHYPDKRSDILME